MVETPLARQDVHKAQIDPVLADRTGDRLELAEAANFAEAAARLPLLLQQVERQSSRRAPEAPPLLRNAAEVERLVLDAHAQPLQDLLELGERDGRLHIGPALGEA